MRETRWPSKAEICFTETGGVIAATVSTSSGEILVTFERVSPEEVFTEMHRLGRMNGCSIVPGGPKPLRMKEYLEKGTAALQAEIEAWDGTPKGE